MRVAVVLLTLIPELALGATRTTRTPARTSASLVVRQVDHILIATTDPGPVFSLFAETLRLPVAWPITDFGNFESGGISVGNVNVEIFRVTDPAPGSAEARGKARLSGVAFEPARLALALEALADRGIDRGKPSHRDVPDNLGGFSWTTVDLPGVSLSDTSVFLCEYQRPDVRASRRTLRDALHRRGGGPLGVEGAEMIVVGAGGDAAYEATWARLFAPAPTRGPRTWAVGVGPAVQVDPSSPKGLQRLVLRVRSLSKATRFLHDAGMLGETTPGEARFSPERVYGLDIRVVGA